MKESFMKERQEHHNQHRHKSFTTKTEKTRHGK